jgi:hypothetical protein
VLHGELYVWQILVNMAAGHVSLQHSLLGATDALGLSPCRPPAVPLTVLCRFFGTMRLHCAAPLRHAAMRCCDGILHGSWMRRRAPLRSH